MNKQNYNQFWNSCYQNAVTPPNFCNDQSYTQVSFTSTLPTYNYGHQLTRIIHSTDNNICDGMNNCHLSADWWSQHAVMFQSLNSMPILSSYMPAKPTIELPVGYQYQDVLLDKEYFESTNRSHQDKYLGEFGSSLTSSMPPPQHQQIMPENFMSQSILKNYDAHRTFNSILRESDINDDEASRNCNETLNCNIKFQDRNKKLDFKVNFRDENLKANGCFHSESSSPNPETAVAAPKKKWIRHYLTTGKKKTFLKIFLKIIKFNGWMARGANCNAKRILSNACKNLHRKIRLLS